MDIKVVFMGSPDFALPGLRALAERTKVIGVVTQPDRAAGRGRALRPPPVKVLAQELGLPVIQPEKLRSPETLDQIRVWAPDLIVVTAFGQILKPELLDLPRYGSLNVHASLLPRWRGAAPIQRAILAGDRETGISIMRMEEGLDSGPVYLMRRIPIAAEDTAVTVHDKLAALGARCIVEALPVIADGTLEAVPQSEAGAIYAPKITKDEAAIDWRREAVEVDRQVRAYNPFPGAYSTLHGEPLKVWRAAVAPGSPAPPGTILRADAQGIVVACGNGALRATELQRAGGKRLMAADFLHGLSLAPGERFGA
jgi:methionyl-tRNA formyltransferase